MQKKVQLLLLAIVLLFLSYFWWKNDHEEIVVLARATKGYENLFFGKEQSILAFSDELMAQIALDEGLGLNLVSARREGLIKGLQEGNYDAIVVDASIFDKDTTRFLYSETFFDLGPVIIVPTKSTVKGVGDLLGKIVGISKDSFLFSKGFTEYHSMLVLPMDSISKGFQLLQDNKIDAIIYDALPGYLYLKNVYWDQFRIIQPPLRDWGLKIVTVKSARGAHIIETFNRGLKKNEENGKYIQLLKKWGFENYPVDFQN